MLMILAQRYCIACYYCKQIQFCYILLALKLTYDVTLFEGLMQILQVKAKYSL